MNTIKQAYTFSGQDVRVFAYRDLSKLRAYTVPRPDLDIIAEHENAQKTHQKLKKESKEILQNDYQVTETRTFRNNETVIHLSNAQMNTKGTEDFGKVDSKILSSVGQTHPESVERMRVTNREILNRTRKSGSLPPYFELGSLDSLSISTFREKVAVRGLGRSHAVGYTRGARTIAGALNFNLMQENELLRFLNPDSQELGHNNTPLTAVLLDQVAPFNIVIMFSNEYGGNSVMQLFNVELASESQRMSVHDLVIQNNINFYATDVIPIQDLGNAYNSTSEMILGITKHHPQAFANEFRNTVKKRIDSVTSGSRASDLLSRSRGLF